MIDNQILREIRHAIDECRPGQSNYVLGILRKIDAALAERLGVEPYVPQDRNRVKM